MSQNTSTTLRSDLSAITGCPEAPSKASPVPHPARPDGAPLSSISITPQALVGDALISFRRNTLVGCAADLGTILDWHRARHLRDRRRSDSARPGSGMTDVRMSDRRRVPRTSAGTKRAKSGSVPASVRRSAVPQPFYDATGWPLSRSHGGGGEVRRRRGAAGPERPRLSDRALACPRSRSARSPSGPPDRERDGAAPGRNCYR
ncbi:hypothetical protein ABIB82_007891 [Bradyrhizobium sp. i1.8.4]